MRRAPLVLVGLAVLTAAGAALPLVYVFVRSVAGGWQGYSTAVFSISTLHLLWRTGILTISVVGFALLLATPMAWCVTRTDLPARRIWALLGALPLAVPSYIAAFCFVAVLGPKGFLQGWIEPWGVERLPEIAYGFSGAVLMMTLYTYPYIFLLLIGALNNLDRSYEESARILGEDAWGTFFRVIVPQLKPALLTGALLVALYTLADFGGVSIVRYNTFTLAIYNAYRSLFDRSLAAGLSSVLVVMTLILISIQGFFLKRCRPTQVRASSPVRVCLGSWKVPVQLLLGVIALFSLGLPLAVIGYWGVRAISVGSPIGSAWGVALNSLSVSSTAAVCAVALSIPVAILAIRFPNLGSRALDRLAHSGYALPGLVIALSLVFFSTRYMLPLYQSVTLLVAAYVVRFLPEALAASKSSIMRVAPVFEEVARTLGRSPMSVLWRVTLPMIRPGLLTGVGLVFLTSMKELPATLILRPTGFETLATRVWSTASEGIYSQAALPALLLLAVSGPPLYWMIIRPALARVEV